MNDQDADDIPTPAMPGPGPKARKPLKPSAETKPETDKKGKKNKPEPTTFAGKLWYNWVKPIGTVVVIVVVLRSMLIDWNDVPTGSMEPEIHVGDRIAVNRLAYALQLPLSGPTIDVPFLGRLGNNPLDFLPQWQWGEPQRGDIVTFWNPVTKVRMVKRIVAVPGDTIEMSGGVLTITTADGTTETASYKDLDAAAEGLPLQTKWQVNTPLGYEKADVAYQEETLLGETRIVQQIKDRWLIDAQVIELPNGDRRLVDEGMFQDGLKDGQPLAEALEQSGIDPEQYTPNVIASAKDGVMHVNDKPVDFNTFARTLLAAYTTGEPAQTLAKYGLKIEGHEGLVNGENVSREVFSLALRDAFGQMSQAEKQSVRGLDTTVFLIFQRASMSSFGPVTIGDDAYLMVGDNRNNSHDGRAFGTIERGEITGEAFAVAFSFEDNKMFALPPDPAWGRFFKDLD